MRVYVSSYIDEVGALAAQKLRVAGFEVVSTYHDLPRIDWSTMTANEFLAFIGKSMTLARTADVVLCLGKGTVFNQAVVSVPRAAMDEGIKVVHICPESIGVLYSEAVDPYATIEEFIEWNSDVDDTDDNDNCTFLPEDDEESPGDEIKSLLEQAENVAVEHGLSFFALAYTPDEPPSMVTAHYCAEKSSEPIDQIIRLLVLAATRIGQLSREKKEGGQ